MRKPAVKAPLPLAPWPPVRSKPARWANGDCLPSVGKCAFRPVWAARWMAIRLSAWLQKPNGERFGSPFTLFDDGAHGDGRAGDGIFSLPDFDAPGKGVGYLWIQGAIGGVNFVRSDPVPFNFQPLEVTILNKEQNYVGGVMALPVRITNLDSRQQCFRGYADSVIVPEGWTFSWTLPPGDDGSEQLFGFCIPARGID